MKSNIFIIIFGLFFYGIGCMNETESGANQPTTPEKDIQSREHSQKITVARESEIKHKIPVKKNNPQKKSVRESSDSDPKKSTLKMLGRMNFTAFQPPAKSEISDFSMNSQCNFLAVGGSSMDLYLKNIKSKKKKWKVIDNIKNGCSKNSCHQKVLVDIFNKKLRVFSALNGDTLRIISQNGSIGAFRGGYPKINVDSAISGDDSKLVIQYKKGLFVYRSTAGIFAKLKDFSGERIFTTKNLIFSADKQMVRVFSMKLKTIASISVHNINSMEFYQKEILAATPEKLHIIDFQYKIKKTVSLPKDFISALIFTNADGKIFLAGKYRAKIVIMALKSDFTPKGYFETNLASEKMIVYRSFKNCFGFSDGKKVYIRDKNDQF
ncbi:MAG: hypothetical protein JXR95_06675 [Deltaproteobacteria bacterium]|nr:hypothetical protein [Deltaproteobacteria bacterium]